MEFDIYIECLGAITPRQKAMLLLNMAGHEAMERERAFVYAAAIPAEGDNPAVPAETRFDVEVLKRKFSQLCEPRKNIIMERHLFNSRVQGAGESFENFLSEVKVKATTCEFGNLHDELVRDRIVTGIKSSYIRKQLLKEPNLTMERAIQLCQIHEQTDRDAEEFGDKTAHGNASNVSSVLALGQKRPGKAKKKFENNFGASASARTQAHDRQKTGGGVCYRCGEVNHRPKECPFITAKCFGCGKMGHIKKACESKKPQDNFMSWKGKKKVNQVDAEETVYDIFNVQVNNGKRFVEDVIVNGKQLQMEIDTGASVSVISERTDAGLWMKEEAPPLNSTTAVLQTYDGNKLPLLGICHVSVELDQQREVLPLFVVKGNQRSSLLGRAWMEKLRLNWDRIHALQDLGTMDMQKYRSVFEEEMGEMKGVTGTIHLKEGAVPRFYKPRPLPYAMKEKGDKELDRLVKENIIVAVQNSEWAAPVVPVLKPNGEVRLCGDYSVTVNRDCQVDQYPIPAIEDLYAKLAGGEKFTKLDLSNAYLQVSLDEASQELLTVNTHRGLYKYKRLPYGVASSPGIFQRAMDTLLQGIPGVCTYLDDILVTGVNDEAHKKSLTAVLDRLLQTGVKAKKNKCVFFQEQIEYLGHRIDSQGLRPMENKVKAVKDAPRPTSVEQLRSYLGLLNHYAKFLPNLSQVLVPLYKLLKKDEKFIWKKEQEEAFEKSKNLLQSEALLVHYDSSRPLVLICDASPYGLGAVLAHKMMDGSERPIAYASRSLAKAEKQYAQLEKEGLACVWAIKRFHKYLFGREFTLVTDHQPLEKLFGGGKPISPMANARIQRWALTLSAYKYSVIHRKGSGIMEADALSRLPLPDAPREVPQPAEMVFLLESMVMPLDQLQRMTAEDALLSKVRLFVWDGWPETASDATLKPYAARKLELSVLNGCVLWGARLCIPVKAQKKMLQLLHEGHPGMVRMKSVARSHVWWPTLNEDIEETVRSCAACLEQRALPETAPLHPWSYPMEPWSRVHVDHAGPFEGKLILVMVDATTKWIEAMVVPSTTSSITIAKMREVFARFGLLKTIVSDNGTSFTSAEFTMFLKKNGIQHIRSAPYHPATNGMAERAVRFLKEGLRKTANTEADLETRINRLLFRYRTTEQTTTKKQPAELMFGRQMRTHLHQLQSSTLQARVSQQQLKQQDNTKSLRSFKVNDHVMVRDLRGAKQWLPGIVIEKQGLQYQVELEEGRMWRRDWTLSGNCPHHGSSAMESVGMPPPQSPPQDQQRTPPQQDSTEEGNAARAVPTHTPMVSVSETELDADSALCTINSTCQYGSDHALWKNCAPSKSL